MSTPLPAPPDGRDPRDIVTPYAFQVHPQLLGLPLASPWQRLAAIAIDGLAVAVLSYMPGGFLVLVASAVLFRWARGARGARRLLRWAGALGGVLALWSLYGSAVDVFGDARRLRSDASDAAALPRLALEVEKKRCADAACAREPLLRFGRFAGEHGWSDEQAADAVADVLRDLAVGEPERARLRADYLARVAEVRAIPAAARGGDRAAEEPDDAAEPGDPTPTYSVLAWARGLLDDLGIGLGWAALYFTAFGAYWNGQTPGKRALGIRVVQLDGSPMTLWESFERYGGYGAGFATGLLGFLQVFWDANRQAIHDKICETVVIRGALPDGGPAPAPASR